MDLTTCSLDEIAEWLEFITVVQKGLEHVFRTFNGIEHFRVITTSITTIGGRITTTRIGVTF
jgi:hypothetical protein